MNIEEIDDDTLEVVAGVEKIKSDVYRDDGRMVPRIMSKPSQVQAKSGFVRLTEEQQVFHKTLDEQRPKCQTCKFWRWGYQSMGECRRNPPSLNGLSSGEYPYVYLLNWCGEHISII